MDIKVDITWLELQIQKGHSGCTMGTELILYKVEEKTEVCSIQIY